MEAMQVNGEHVVRVDPSATEWGSLNSATRMQITFRDMNYSVKVKPQGSKLSNLFGQAELKQKRILRNVSGVIQPGRMTAVMGASGAGKTTFLNVLAGFSQPNTQVDGTICVNQQPVTSSQMREISGFVHQEDVILETMTVREALQFAAQLKLPSSLPQKQKIERAMQVAEMLNLTKALDNAVGSSLAKGISGGEKRRLSLGMEMITNPSILFLDEPTSGLDTYTAYKVIRLLNDVVHSQGRTVVATIHQPSSDVFHLFDDLLVLANGQVLYMGEVEKMVPHFSALGYSCPTFCNPADFLFMDVLYLGKLEDGGQPHKATNAILPVNESALASVTTKANEQNEARVQKLLEEWPRSAAYTELQAKMSEDKLLKGGVHQAAVPQRAGFATQFSLLARRAWANQWRNKLMLPTKVAQTVFLSVLVGLIYLNLGNDYKSVQDRQGSLFFLAVQSLFGSILGTVTVFGGEKAVFMREYASRMYGLPGYFISRYIVELPTRIILPFVMACITYWMVGYQAALSKFLWYGLIFILMDNCGATLGMLLPCVFGSIEVVMSVMPMVLMPLMIFSGFFVNSDSIAPYFIWIYYISPIRYGFAAMGLNEFEGLHLTCKPTDPCPPGFNGDMIIKSLHFDGTVQSNAATLFGLTWAWLLLSYVALWINLKLSHR